MCARGGIKGRVDQHLLDARAAVPDGLRSAFDRLVAGRGLLQPDPAPYFGVLGHPLFELPCWTFARLRDGGARLDEAALSRVLGVSALGYLHARAHDDWLDGDAPGDVAPVALAGVLLARCTRLLAAVAGASERFWGRYEEVMAAYAGALRRTEELRRAGTPATRATFEELLAQSRPLAIPSLALLERAGRWDLAPALEEFVFASAASGQLFNDLTDSYRDRDRGQRTWVVETIDGAAAAPAPPLWSEALAAAAPGAGGPLAAAVGEALAFHDRACVAARDLGLVEAEGWLDERRRALEGLPAALGDRLLAAFTRRLGGEGSGSDNGTGDGTGKETIA